MKFIVSTTTLHKQLQLISGVISSNTVLPILEDFLFDLKDSKLSIYSTDLETSMSTVIEVESKDEGKIAIPGSMLLETLKSLPEQPLTFKIDEKTFAVQIITANGNFKLCGEDGKDYPRIPEPENVKDIAMPCKTLLRAIENTLFSVSNDELRPSMTGVYFQLDSKGITFVSTDAHKLARYTCKDVNHGSETGNFIVPKKAITLLKSSLPSGSEIPVEIAYSSSNAFFSFGETKMTCRLIDARYPDYNAVIPTENPNRLTISRPELSSSLKRIAIYANKTTHQVILNIKGSELILSASDLDFSNEAKEKLTCEYEGENIEIGFNARFLIEVLSVITTEEVIMELSTPNRAGIILPTETEKDEEILMLVMPVMLNQ